MKIFDGHGDIWYDLAQRKKENIEDRFKSFHLPKFEKGNICGGIFIAYLEHKKDLDDQKEMMYMINTAMEELYNNSELYNIIRRSGEFDENSKKVNVLMGIEGLRSIGEDIRWINTFFQLGFRHASLTWNEENALATGVAGDKDRGLTNLGIEVIKKMEKLGMIIDCSHSNEKTFWDIVENTEKPFIASHSNSKRLCNHRRNLTPEQIKTIGERGGVIGVNAFKSFVSLDEKEQTLEKYVDHIEDIISISGIENVALGFDFCEYLDGVIDTSINPIGLEDVTYAQNVIKELEKRKYKKEDIELIAFGNFKRIINQILPSS